MIESLENRLLYSNGVRHRHPVFSVNGDTLSVSGSFRNDVIVIGGHSDRIHLSLNGVGKTIRGAITRVVIYGGVGDDQITNTASFSVYMDGGTGNDALQSGTGFDTLLGGTGDDTLTGQQYTGQPVYMDGGPGDDTLTYGSTMYGGRGYDVGTVEGGLFNELTVNGGLEEYRSFEDSYPLDPYPTLATRHGRLVFSYQSDGQYDRSITGPFVRDDGQVAITVDNTYAASAPPAPPAAVWRVTFSDVFTELAKRRGVVLTVGNPSSGDTPDVRVVLIPAT